MFKRVIYIVVLIFTASVFGQNYVKHTVLEGETIQTIAQKYKVTPYDIYKLNPDSQSGIKPSSVVLIPKTVEKSNSKIEEKPLIAEVAEVKKTEEKVKEYKQKPFEINAKYHTVAQGDNLYSISKKYDVSVEELEKNNPDAVNGLKIDQKIIIKNGIQKGNANPKVVFAKTHEVQAKETLYSISKEYKVSIEDLEEENPFLKVDGLQPGQKLAIPTGKKNYLTQAKTPVLHEVQAKETKYGIATKYGITVEELEKQNPEVVENLPIGYKLKIFRNTNKPEVSVKEKVVEVVEEEKPKFETPKATNLLDYTVKSGETMYSLTRQFALSELTLTNLNPDLKNGVREGMVLKVPANLSFAKEVKNNFKDLTKTVSKQNKKELVLFLPFNTSKIQSDTLTSIGERLKKDKFLNMTLDFYSGALMAIDSAKVLGINMDVKIYDSEETKNTTNALNVISENDFSKTNAVIGPFYQVNVEKVAAALESKNIPVISPLSKEEGKSYSNLYQTVPSTEAVKSAMFEYMRAKNGNVIAAIDAKKNSVRDYIKEFHSDTKIVGLTDKGSIVADSIKKLFVKDKMNYVVMASESTQTILSITSILQNAMKDFQVQLVILEPNETLDFEEIPLSRLTKLKMAYPSATKENDSDLASKFERAYKKKNKVIPNQYATRGFDVTFDTMLRLAQDKSFEETLDIATEQVESKFDYNKKVTSGYVNDGIYILYYDTDLTIKQAQ
ncbi:LysM peptidoglycan-binding domain-containing protein [Flavobacterium sp.]|uniref:LysM peptidoglycan-binding domain-containing protein n=1 Tax=Flavobacterium sp. TaxID=239 RepID=UPI00261F69CD|nr:LysM peptidoglycan-binding domain-containing protein [Flavobacterium sp.]